MAHDSDGKSNSERIFERMKELAELLESELPADSGVMIWFYPRAKPDELTFCASHTDERETINVLQTTLSKLIAREELAARNEKPPRRPALFVSSRSGDSVPPSRHLVSSATALKIGGHDHMRIWSRGALAGELILEAGDADTLATRMHLIEVKDDPEPENGAIP